MEMVKHKWNVTNHASKRAQERFGIEEHLTQTWLSQMMQYAVAVEEGEDGRVVYEHKHRPIRLVANPEKNEIITVMERNKKVTPAHAPLVESLAEAVSREIRKLKRDYTREYRLTELQQAELSLERAQLFVNRARARNPKIQDRIEEKTEELTRRIAQLQKRKTELQAQYKRAIVKAEVFLAELAGEERGDA